MIDKTAATEIVWNFLKAKYPAGHERIDIMDEATMEKNYGWVFFYQSKVFLETRNPLQVMFGISPIVVERDGTLHELVGYGSFRKRIEDFENQRKDHS